MRFPTLFRSRRLSAICSLLFLLFGIVPISAGGALAYQNGATSGALTAFARVHPRHVEQTTPLPPTDAQCRSQIGVPCYAPQEIRQAYGLTSVLKAGFTGTGETIVVIDSFGSPTLQNDLTVFDAGYGLPNPPSLKVLAPLGTVPFDPTNSDMVNWAFETTLDVEWSHAMAPGANIVVLTSPVSETQGTQGMPQFAALLQYALNNHLGQVISQSWGTTENTLFTTAGTQIYNNFEALYQQAAKQGVTVFASAGDSGVANVDVNNNPYPFPTVIYPASSPWVTSVGGTSLTASTKGQYQSEIVWNDGQPSNGAGGGGVSQYFAEPAYQNSSLPASDQTLLNGFRGVPDVAYNADPNTSILVYISFVTPTGYYLIGGTSEGSPQWAGIIADGDQMAGHSLGFLNPQLYRLGVGSNSSALFHDVTSGNNGQDNLPGYSATVGWDATTGVGSPNAGALLKALTGV